MAYCQAFGCSNKRGRTKRPGETISYFSFPDPVKEKCRAQRWLHNIGTGFTLKTFKFGEWKTVCSDHFHEDCFEVDRIAAALGYAPKKRTLKEGAIPTIFSYKTYDTINMNGEKPLNQPPKSLKRMTANTQKEIVSKIQRTEESHKGSSVSLMEESFQTSIAELPITCSSPEPLKKDFSQQFDLEAGMVFDPLNFSSPTMVVRNDYTVHQTTKVIFPMSNRN